MGLRPGVRLRSRAVMGPAGLPGCVLRPDLKLSIGLPGMVLLAVLDPDCAIDLPLCSLIMKGFNFFSSSSW